MQAKIQLTATGRLFPFLIGLLLVLQLVVPSRAWTLLLVVLAGALLVSRAWAWEQAHKVSITRRQRYGWVHVGDLMEETFHLDNTSPLPLLWVEILDRSDLPGYTASTVRSAGSHSSLTWHIEGICTRRGLFTLGPWQARLGDPFGLVEVVCDFPDTRSILVYPPVVHLPTLQVPRGASTGAGRTSRRSLDLTASAAGVRAYAYGDSLNRIHWRSTARRGELMVKEFDLQPAGDLWILLDLEASVQAGQGEESTEEYGVILAASLAGRMLAENRAVGLVVSGQRRTFLLPQRGQSTLWRVLQTLATAQAGDGWPLEHALLDMDRNLGRGMALAVITPNCRPAWPAGLLPPMRRGIAPTVVLLDPVSFGGRGNSAALQAMLAELGVPSHSIAQGTPFRPIVEHERIGRPELRVLPATGRVIPAARPAPSRPDPGTPP